MHLHSHLYTDNTQIYSVCAPVEASVLQQRILTGVDRVDASEPPAAERCQNETCSVRHLSNKQGDHCQIPGKFPVGSRRSFHAHNEIDIELL